MDRDLHTVSLSNTRSTSILVLAHEVAADLLSFALAVKSLGLQLYALVPAEAEDPPLDWATSHGVVFEGWLRARGPWITSADALAAHSRILIHAPRLQIVTMSLWQGHRAIAAELNRAEGIGDSSPEALRLAADRLLMRLSLRRARLTQLRCFRIDGERSLGLARRAGLFWMVRARCLPAYRQSSPLGAEDTLASLRSSWMSPGSRYGAVAADLMLEQVVWGLPCTFDVLAFQGRYVAARRGPGFQDGLAAHEVQLRTLACAAVGALRLSHGVFEVGMLVRPGGEAEVLSVRPRRGEGPFGMSEGANRLPLELLAHLALFDLRCRALVEEIIMRHEDSTKPPVTRKLRESPPTQR